MEEEGARRGAEREEVVKEGGRSVEEEETEGESEGE